MKKFIILPTNKIAMFAFNLLPFVDFYLKGRGPEYRVFIPRSDWIPFLGKPSDIANEQLYKMCLRSFRENDIPYSESKALSVIYYFLAKAWPKSISTKRDFKNDLDFYENMRTLFGIMPQYLAETRRRSEEFAAFNRCEPFLKFSEEEIEIGLAGLRAQGIDVSKEIVTFHSRDGEFHKHYAKEHDFRDSRSEDYFDACSYLESKDIYCFRMGKIQKRADGVDFTDRITDYTSSFRSDFLDIFLIGRSKFFIGNTSGLWGVPYLFNVPIVGTNFIPMRYVLLNSRDIYIPKRLWLKREKRFLRFKEILGIEFNIQYNSEFYVKNGIEVIDNTKEEIRDVVQEMNERIDGGCNYTEEDECLQSAVRKMFEEKMNGHRPPSRIGREFIRSNRDLLR